MGLQRIYRARERLWLVGDQAQQAGLGANAREILAKVVVQGLRQVGAGEGGAPYFHSVRQGFAAYQGSNS